MCCGHKYYGSHIFFITHYMEHQTVHNIYFKLSLIVTMTLRANSLPYGVLTRPYYYHGLNPLPVVFRSIYDASHRHKYNAYTKLSIHFGHCIKHTPRHYVHSCHSLNWPGLTRLVPPDYSNVTSTGPLTHEEVSHPYRTRSYDYVTTYYCCYIIKHTQHKELAPDRSAHTHK